MPVRIGYMDQDRPPYWLGNGNEVAEPPGAGVEYLRAATAAVLPCPVQWVRLPLARMRSALQSGEIDFAPLGDRMDYPPEYALPRDRSGAPDRSRALATNVIMLVRSADHLPADTDTPHYFQDRLIGVPTGAPYAPSLRAAGYKIDEGGRDLDRNIGKLRLKRIDGVALTVAAPGDMDYAVASRYGSEVVRLRVPLVTAHIWLVANQNYYVAHREQVEALWNWMATHQGELGALLGKYSRK